MIAFSTVAIDEALAFRGFRLKNLAEGTVGGCVGAHGASVAAAELSFESFGVTRLAYRDATAASALVVMCDGMLRAPRNLRTDEVGVSIGRRSRIKGSTDQGVRVLETVQGLVQGL